MSEIKKIDLEEFNDLVLESKKTVLVDFFATWCGPCKMLAPILEEVSKENDTDTIICKVDVDENFDLAKSYGVMSVPTIILFKDGAEAKRSIGLKNKEFLLDMIKN
ncbi:MAG: thioredoxin [Clostridiales bacterium]|nr:thioredoxin [Clostridiales bacterium]